MLKLVFASTDVLVHGDLDEPLAWRMEGETYEPESDSDSSSEEEEVEGEEVQFFASCPLLAWPAIHGRDGTSIYPCHRPKTCIFVDCHI